MPDWRLFYHLTWGTQDRTPLIEARFEASLHNVLAAKTRTLGAFVYAVGGTDDHVHLVAAIPPRLSVADCVGLLKGSSSHWVNHTQGPASRFAWQTEYGVVSFGGRQLDRVVRYVQNQRSHHQEGTALPFLERVAAAADEGPDPALPTRPARKPTDAMRRQGS